MTTPEHATAAQAADPATPLQLLADIAAQRPDLRAIVAANPAAYPALLEWLGSLGDPAVDAALRGRAEASPGERSPAAAGPGGGSDVGTVADGATGPDGVATPGEPVSDGVAAHGSDPGAEAVPGVADRIARYASGPGPDFAPLGEVGGAAAPGPAPQGPDLPVPTPAAYSQPAAAPVGPPQHPTGHPARPGPLHGAGAPYAGAPGAPYGAPGQPWQTPTPKRSNKPLWIALSVIGVLFLAAVGLFVLLVVRGVEAAGSPGGDAALDALYEACADGDMQACDDLYLDSPWGSEYEEFGDTCGGRTTGWTWCVDEDLG